MQPFEGDGRQVYSMEGHRGELSAGRIDPLVPIVPAAASFDLTELYVGHRVRLVNLASAILLDRSAAEEVVQDAFVALHGLGDSIDAPDRYLQRTVVNRSISLIRRRQTMRRHPIPPPPPAAPPEIDETWAAVCKLPAKQRAVVAMRFWQDMTFEQIAATLGQPTGSVKSSLHRALRRLKKELS